MKNNLIYILGILMLFYTTSLHGAERIQIEGTRVNIISPKNFLPAQNFPGFILEKANASILISEIPGPFSEVSAGFTTAGAAAKGMTLISKEAIKDAPNSGLLLKLGQQAYGRQFLKWIYVFGTETDTFMVTGTFPQEFEQQLSDDIKKSVLSSRLNLKKQIDPYEGLHFKVTDSSAFKVAKRMVNMIMMTEDGLFTPKPNPPPLFIAGSSVSQGMALDDKEAFATERVKSIGTMTNVRITFSNPITIDGLNGFEIVADSTHIKSQQAKIAYQVILFGDTDYYIMQGIAPRSEKKKYVKEFKILAHSFKRI